MRPDFKIFENHLVNQHHCTIKALNEDYPTYIDIQISTELEDNVK